MRYLRELHADEPVRVTFQLLDYDAKRMHFFEQLFHAADGWVSATSENMALHVDMGAGKTAAFPIRRRHRLGPDEGRPCQAAGAGSGRPPHRDGLPVISRGGDRSRNPEWKGASAPTGGRSPRWRCGPSSAIFHLRFARTMAGEA